MLWDPRAWALLLQVKENDPRNARPDGEGHGEQTDRAGGGGRTEREVEDGQSGKWRLHRTTLTRGHVCHKAGNCPSSTLDPHDQQAEHRTKASNVLTRKREAAPVTWPPFSRSLMVTATPYSIERGPSGPHFIA